MSHKLLRFYMHLKEIYCLLRLYKLNVSERLFLAHILLEFFLLTFAKKECVNSGVWPQRDDVTVTKGTRKEKGKTVEDIKVAKIKWRPDIENNKEIFDDYDLSKLELDVRVRDGAWEIFVPQKEVKYLGYYEWNVPRIPQLIAG